MAASRAGARAAAALAAAARGRGWGAVGGGGPSPRAPAWARLVASASSSRPSTAHVADETEWRRATARADHVRPRTPLNHPDGTRNDPGSCVAQPGTTRLSIQESYDPNGVAFASGPSNPDGLGLRSYRGQAPGSLDAEFTARAAHQGFPGIVCGGILGALCESHANWTAAISIMDHFSTPSPPLTVTHSFTVELLSPTPVDEPLLLRSRVVGADPDYKSLDVAVGVYRRTGASVDAGPLPPPPQKQRSDGKEELDWKDEGAMHIDGYVLTARSVGRFRKIGPLRAIR